MCPPLSLSLSLCHFHFQGSPGRGREVERARWKPEKSKECLCHSHFHFQGSPGREREIKREIKAREIMRMRLSVTFSFYFHFQGSPGKGREVERARWEPEKSSLSLSPFTFTLSFRDLPLFFESGLACCIFFALFETKSKLIELFVVVACVSYCNIWL